MRTGAPRKGAREPVSLTFAPDKGMMQITQRQSQEGDLSFQRPGGAKVIRQQNP